MTEDKFLEVLSIGGHDNAINQIYQDILLLSDYGKDLWKLTEAQKVVYYITCLEREIYNGGFNQFFYNGSGSHAHETENALKAINAETSLKLFQKAVSYWPNRLVPIDTVERRKELLEKVERIADPQWDGLDLQYYKDEDQVSVKLFQFILGHSNNFY